MAIRCSDLGNYIFVSYARQDKQSVLPWLERLSNAGYNIWFDQNIVSGERWRKEIADHLDSCSTVLFFGSRNFFKSDYCRKEVIYTSNHKKHYQFLYLEDPSHFTIPNEIEFEIGEFQYTLASDANAFQAICKGLPPKVVPIVPGIASVRTSVAMKNQDPMDRPSQNRNWYNDRAKKEFTKERTSSSVRTPNKVSYNSTSTVRPKTVKSGTSNTSRGKRAKKANSEVTWGILIIVALLLCLIVPQLIVIMLRSGKGIPQILLGIVKRRIGWGTLSLAALGSIFLPLYLSFFILCFFSDVNHWDEDDHFLAKYILATILSSILCGFLLFKPASQSEFLISELDNGDKWMVAGETIPIDFYGKYVWLLPVPCRGAITITNDDSADLYYDETRGVLGATSPGTAKIHFNNEKIEDISVRIYPEYRPDKEITLRLDGINGSKTERYLTIEVNSSDAQRYPILATYNVGTYIEWGEWVEYEDSQGSVYMRRTATLTKYREFDATDFIRLYLAEDGANIPGSVIDSIYTPIAYDMGG